eukprot:scaffold47403_cov21-Prasinocladus_malaysianus.AAC.2
MKAGAGSQRTSITCSVVHYSYSTSTPYTAVLVGVYEYSTRTCTSISAADTKRYRHGRTCRYLYRMSTRTLERVDRLREVRVREH